jgi:hypothetical protein
LKSDEPANFKLGEKFRSKKFEKEMKVFFEKVKVKFSCNYFSAYPQVILKC